MPRRYTITFILQLLIIFSLIIAGTQTFYLIHGKQSIPNTLSAAFPGMAIYDGILHPPYVQPYSPPAYLITPILNQLLGLPAMFNNEADSLIIIDTTENAPIPLKIPAILFKARKMVEVLNTNTKMEFSYENIMFGRKDLLFTADNIRQFLISHLLSIFVGYYISSVIHQGVVILFSIFFLAFAAYIFRIDRMRNFKEYLKIASFVISPIAVGSALIAISGVKIEWTWHILIFISTIVMFRAIFAINSKKIPHGG